MYFYCERPPPCAAALYPDELKIEVEDAYMMKKHFLDVAEQIVSVLVSSSVKNYGFMAIIRSVNFTLAFKDLGNILQDVKTRVLPLLIHYSFNQSLRFLFELKK